MAGDKKAHSEQDEALEKIFKEWSEAGLTVRQRLRLSAEKRKGAYEGSGKLLFISVLGFFYSDLIGWRVLWLALFYVSLVVTLDPVTHGLAGLYGMIVFPLMGALVGLVYWIFGEWNIWSVFIAALLVVGIHRGVKKLLDG